MAKKCITLQYNNFMREKRFFNEIIVKIIDEIIAYLNLI